MATLADVPDGVLAHVFALLAAPNRPAVRLVCKHWCQLARSSHAFWANLKIVLCSTTSPSALGVLYRLLAKKKNILIQLEVAAAGAGESLRFTLSNTVVGNLQSLVTLKVTYAFELPGSFTDRVEAMDLQHFSRLSALRWLTIDIHDNKPEGEMLEEELINLFIEPEAGLPLQLPSLPSLTSLHELTLTLCRRLASSPEAWPPEMSRMTRLHTLRLELLQLPQLPAPVCRLSSLTCLGLEGNQLQTLPEGPYLSNLRRLSLSWNRLPRIPLALALASRLEELDLASNNGPSLWPAGLQVLQGLKQLRRELINW
ncbi:hypothetical protein N2152v2_002861 [Parachlorella kessleri]